MLEQVPQIFDNMDNMIRKLSKKSYEAHMDHFRREHGHYFYEMTYYVEESEDRDKAARELADDFTGKVRGAFEKNGKIKGTLQVDLNFFMVYYVFPAILLTKYECAELICQSLCDSWEKTFPGNKIGYTDYDKLYNAIREKIFGIF